MKKEVIQLILAVFALIFSGAIEELAPKFLGAGLPVLLCASAYYAVRRTPLAGVLFAMAAGAMEDALSGLPFALSLSFFTAFAGLVRGFRLSAYWAIPAYCLYQVWLWIWLGEALNGSVFSRTFGAVPLGLVTVAVTCAVLTWIDRRAAVDEK